MQFHAVKASFQCTHRSAAKAPPRAISVNADANDLAMAIATGNTNMLSVFPTTAPPQRPGSSRRSYPAPTSFRTW